MQDFFDAIKHLAGGEVYAVVAPPGALYPTLIYTPIDQSSVVSLDGPGPLRRARVQVMPMPEALRSAISCKTRFWLHCFLKSTQSWTYAWG